MVCQILGESMVDFGGFLPLALDILEHPGPNNNSNIDNFSIQIVLV